MTKVLTATLFTLASLAGMAQAGVEIQLEERALPSGQVDERMSMLSEGWKLKMESRPGTAARASQAMLFDANKKEMVVLSHQGRSYMRIDEERATQMSGQVNAAMEQMKAQLANLPPEQRAMVEQMMKQRMPSGDGWAAAPKKE